MSHKKRSKTYANDEYFLVDRDFYLIREKMRNHDTDDTHYRHVKNSQSGCDVINPDRVAVLRAKNIGQIPKSTTNAGFIHT